MDLQPSHLQNEWVKLSPLQPDDFEALYQVASDPLIWEQHPNPDRYKKEVFMNYFKGAMESRGALLISDANDRIIGCSRFYDHFPEKREINIGYTFFSRSCWGKPYNQSAKRLMIEYALQYTDRIVFQIGAGNIRSQKAIEKLGAVKTEEREVAYYGETPVLNFMYCISKSAWQAK